MYVRPCCVGSVKTNRLRDPGTGTVSDTSDPPSRAESTTRCVPRLGRRRTPGSSSAVHTPVALTTARARTVSLIAGERVAEPRGLPRRFDGFDAREDGCPVPGRRPGDGHDEARVVDELPVPSPHRAAEVVAPDGGRQPERLGDADRARRVQHRVRRADEPPEPIAEPIARTDDRALRQMPRRVEREHLRDRARRGAARCA